MDIFPAIDLCGGKVVRLRRGDYAQMTVYSDDPLSVARDFASCGADFLHTVDLDGAKDADTPNFDVIGKLAKESGLRVEVGGGIRDAETIRRYLDGGVWRVILGTAAVSDPGLLRSAAAEWGGRIAVGVDIRDGMVAVRGWRETSGRECFEFCRELEKIGVETVICTDISRDGMLGGTNVELYRLLCSEFKMKFVASGGVGSVDDIVKLREIGLSGAIIGRALYEGKLGLAEALEAANGN